MSKNQLDKLLADIEKAGRCRLGRHRDVLAADHR